ncbi:MAG: hypothetical protein CSA11_10830 [Chloroflexi bacterium]|nr:MAG: hypothetical protein CSA11_10830 [Chloroflexota bacterium]
MAEITPPTTEAIPTSNETAVSGHTLRETSLHIIVFLGQKLGYAAIILLLIIFFSFFGIALAGGADGRTAVITALSAAATYIFRLFGGSMGLTTAGSNTLNPLPVTQVIQERLPISLALLGLALLFSATLGLFLGVRAARNRAESAILILIATIIGVSVPSFFAAFLLQWGVTSITRWTGKTFLPVGGFGWDSHLILPVLVLSARPVAQITRMAFVSLRNVLRQDYVQTARSKGLRQHTITLRHILRNAAIPILTTVGMSLRFALSSLPVVELYFGIPGVGSTLLKGIAQQDANLTVGLTLCFGAIFILVNMILELSYRFIDPRLWETPSHISKDEHHSRRDTFKAWGEDVKDLVTDNALAHWFTRRKQPPEPSPFTKIIAKRTIQIDQDPYLKTGARRAWRNVFKNTPFVIGSILVLMLILIILFGPAMSPNNPYNTQGLARINDVLKPPPFEPSQDYPWGSDPMGRGIMSLILTGAQMTLILSVLAVLARLGLGVLFGVLAGWRRRSWLDHAIVGLSEVVAAFPTLILAMILILAIGIREGLSTFVLTLSLVGWGEIMQYVRSEVIAIRPKAYIESAVALGAHTPRIVNKHILPQLGSALISLAALEMGSVLMLLGELGFISIFIGGGSFIDLPGVPASLYSDVPEWGALLSNVRYYSRSYPWVALYPMLAFFVAILSFNLFGEGVRWLVDNGSLVINKIFNKYTIAGTVTVILAILWLQNNSGRTPFLREYAETFSGEQARVHVEYLAAEEMNGRSLGTPGQTAAAQYIADQFATLGLQTAGQENTFFQERKHSYERLLAVPEFTIQDGGPDLTYGVDYAAYPGRTMTAGTADGKLVFLGLGRPQGSTFGVWYARYPELDRMDLSEHIIITLSDWEADILTEVQKDGMLVVTDDPAKLAKAYTYSGRSGRPLNLFTGEAKGEETPTLWISEETANRLLQGTGITVADLRQQYAQLAIEEVHQFAIDTQASMSVAGEIVKGEPVQHVIGFWPGDEGYEFCEDCMDRQLIVVMAQLDTPPPDPIGEIHPGANNNASGLSIMLETIRMMKESGYQPARSMMFIAFNGEGLDGGEPVSQPDIKRFLQAKTGFASTYEPEAIIYLRGLGTGEGNRLQVAAAGSLRLADLFETSARQMGVKTERGQEEINIGLVYADTGAAQTNANAAPVVTLSWQGWEATSRTPDDTLDTISTDILEQAGRALSLALMTLGDQESY